MDSSTTNELILSEIIKINDNLLKVNNRLDTLENDVKDLKQGQEEIIKTINYVGSKVFDNHEVRIASLEKATRS